MYFLKSLTTLSLLISVTLIVVAQLAAGATVTQTCPKSTKCTAMTKCSTAFKTSDRNKLPPICKWQNSDPWVCCPTPSKLQIKALKEFPEKDCAGPQVFTLPSILRINVVGGRDVSSINFYPFMVGIYQTAGKEKVFLCGGTLLSKDVILTAAHCFLAKEDSSKYMVQLGSAVFGTSRNKRELKEFQVSSVKIHEGFKYPQLYNDIALLKFKGLNGFSNAIRPACFLDKAKDKKAKPEVTVLGWGSKQISGSLSSILQEAEIKAIPNRQCNSTLAAMGALTVSFPKGIVNNILCAGGANNAIKDACQGDSGGPLVALIDGKWRVRGVVSGGNGCGIPGNPGIYTRVAEYITWIKSNA